MGIKGDFPIDFQSKKYLIYFPKEKLAMHNVALFVKAAKIPFEMWPI